MNRLAQIATVCHEVNRSICEASGDFSQKSWNEAEQWQRDSALRGVQFAMDNPGASADAQHNAWLNDKLNDGWVYGPVKDADAKVHPCICAYDELPFEQRVKDHAFKAVVKAMAKGGL